MTSLLVDAAGSLAAALTGGNRPDVTQLLPLLDDLAARPVAGKLGRPRSKPDALADRGYDVTKDRRLLWARGIKPVIAKRGVAHGSRLGASAGSSRGHSPTSTTSGGCGSATTASPTSIPHYC